MMNFLLGVLVIISWLLQEQRGKKLWAQQQRKLFFCPAAAAALGYAVHLIPETRQKETVSTGSRQQQLPALIICYDKYRF